MSTGELVELPAPDTAFGRGHPGTGTAGAQKDFAGLEVPWPQDEYEAAQREAMLMWTTPVHPTLSSLARAFGGCRRLPPVATHGHLTGKDAGRRLSAPAASGFARTQPVGQDLVEHLADFSTLLAHHPLDLRAE
jgi:hypothetical protein